LSGRKRHLILVSILFAAALRVYSFSLYMPSDPEVSELIALYEESGRVFPGESFPLSRADLDAWSADLRRSSDSREIRRRIDAYRAKTGFRKGYVHRQTDSDYKTAVFFSGDKSGTYGRYPEDFYTTFVMFPDFAWFGFYAGAEEKSGFGISAGLKREYHPDSDPDTNLFISTSSDPAKMENYFLRSGYIAWRTGDFEFRLGRTPVHYGDAKFSTFLPSDRLPWLDTFTYRYEVGPLTMTSFFGTLDSRISDDEERIFIDDGATLTSEEGETVTFNDTADPLKEPVLYVVIDGVSTATDYAFRDTVIFNSMHRFVLSWDRLRLGLSAYIVVARENNALQIGDIFPVFSWHNAVLGSNNMNLVLDAGYALFNGVFLYGQAAWDDINASDIFGIPDSSVPTIGAYLAGISWIPRFLGDMGLSASMEIGKTHYLWGNYYAYDSWKGSYLSRAIYRYHAQKGTYWMPLTSPYGPGTWWIEGTASVQPLPSLKVTGGFTYLRFNSDVNLFTTPYVYDPSLESYDSTSFSVTLKGQYTHAMGDTRKLIFSAAPSWFSYRGHGWPELELALELKGRKIKPWNGKQ